MKRVGSPILILLTSILSVMAFGAAPASAQENIRGVDFRNFTYRPDCAYEDHKDVTVRNGNYSQDQGDDKIDFNVRQVEYGDLNGDGAEEAVIRTSCHLGGTGDFSEGFIYTMRIGKPALLTLVPGGDRADGGLHRLSIARGLVVVESYASKEPGVGLCCPEFIDTRRYRGNGKKLVPVGKRSRRAYKEDS